MSPTTNRREDYLTKLTDNKLDRLVHYSERARVINGLQRDAIHQRLLELGYIREGALNLQDLEITITNDGRSLLNARGLGHS